MAPAEPLATAAAVGQLHSVSALQTAAALWDAL
eukprot:CAMPEP_0179168430 /NCGR_PEP_ID=MMETSP0796-20121207/82849_1 /TAXON_ID=73915 /ORGANISM="Pyrodinium bahamense, Strain pbaha01" /LENGTH=32 /DNA_ID= /DNA_START= /DNA_END= /DNA_ORIENTATION=